MSELKVRDTPAVGHTDRIAQLAKLLCGLDFEALRHAQISVRGDERVYRERIEGNFVPVHAPEAVAILDAPTWRIGTSNQYEVCVDLLGPDDEWSELTLFVFVTVAVG